MKIKLQQAADVLQKADEVLVLSHKSPDGDTLGSASALCTALQRMGKQNSHCPASFPHPMFHRSGAPH